MKKTLYLILVLVVVGVGAYLMMDKKGSAPVVTENSPASFDGKNASFTIDGKKVDLVNGSSETEAAPGSASKIVTTYFGNEVTGDLTGDGLPDTAFLVTQSTGGSGLFYYAVVAVKTGTGYKTTNAFFIGDRIAPQAMEIPGGTTELNVNYATRKSGEPMTAQPSQGMSVLLKVTPQGVLTSV